MTTIIAIVKHEYFLYDSLTIKLPKVRSSIIKKYKPIEENEAYAAPILIGPIKSNPNIDSIALQLGARVTNEQDLLLWYEEILNEYSSETHSRIKYLIVADQATLISRLQSLVQEMKRLGINNIHLHYLVEESLADDVLEFGDIPINQLNFNTAKLVKDLLP